MRINRASTEVIIIFAFFLLSRGQQLLLPFSQLTSDRYETGKFFETMSFVTQPSHEWKDKFSQPQYFLISRHIRTHLYFVSGHSEAWREVLDRQLKVHGLYPVH